MEARDLKLNNLVYFNGNHNEVGIITGIVEAGIGYPSMVYLNHRIDITESTGTVKPIPLTEDWLINKFDFEDWGVVEVNQYESYRRFVAYNVLDGTSNFEVHLTTSTYGGTNHVTWDFYVDKDESINVKESKYVHNLQNVFYLYAGFELELKTEVNQ